MGRRRLWVAASVVVAASVAVVPLAAAAAPSAPRLTLVSPVAESATGGVVAVQWSYAGFHRTTPVDVEVRRGADPFVRVARVPVDDGSPGYVGSASWATSAADDGADWEVRVIAPTNKRVSSSVAPVVVDNTGPVTTIDHGDTAVSVLSDVTGTAADALGSVAGVWATIGGGSPVPADCTAADCSTWRVSTAGLAPGAYEVQAWAVDGLGNVGERASVTFTLMVGTPTVTVPDVTVPDVTVPPVTVPDVTPPPVTVPEVTPESVVGELLSTVPVPTL